MNKKAIGHHLDWMLAIGLFMVYILFVIVMLKPGIDPLYKGSVLLDLVQDNLMNEINWEITKVPIHIKISSTCPVENGDIKINFPFDWNEKLRLFRENGNELAFSASPKVNLILDDVWSGTGEETLSLMYSPDFTNGESGISGSCSPADYTYGIAEMIKGICDNGNCGDKIDVLFNKNYADVKTEWNFPPNKEFSIQIENRKFPQNLVPPTSADVFVRQIPNYLLKQNGELIPVTITIIAW
ncbi:MAG: hypothetical protein PHD81_00455 [Candidatus Nanoarchaeia archaeon]|nr:hypothetical protein [Candidatus Nanoarchaeia archaeon]MDD5587561.1 hypothetical protein [Candidatus Nanoarchaeia archaeon]